MFRSVSGYDKTYKGLENSMGANNCFLNVVIQSLWHLASFRTSFKDLTLHKHKKRKKVTRDAPGEVIPADASNPPMNGYPSSGPSPYPSIDPMPSYPALGGENSSMTVPTAKHKHSSGSAGYPSASAYPNPGSMGAPPTYNSKPAYTNVENIAYPSFGDGSGTRFHEEVKPSYGKNKPYVPSSKIAYPSFDDSGDIN
jgi:hypothetical protein